jgi:ATP-dependent 26S proteasome regulatory subunit
MGRSGEPAGLEDGQLVSWSLRTLVCSGGYLRWDQLTEAESLLRVSHVPAPPEKTLSNHRSLRRWLERHAEQAGRDDATPDVLRVCAQRLAGLFGLTEVERDLIVFAALSRAIRGVRECLELGASGSRRGFMTVIAGSIGHDPDAVIGALRPEGFLAATGLLRVAPGDGGGPLLLPEPIELALRDDVATDAEVAARFRPVEPPADLGLDDFAHLGEPLDAALALLERAVAAHRPGTNVLVAGPSGSGRTQLVRSLAARLGATLHPAAADPDDSPYGASDRIDRLSGLQQLLARLPAALILVDDADLELGMGQHVCFGSDDRLKVLRTFRDTPVPTVWVVSQAQGMDPAVLRQLDACIQVPAPGREERRRLLERHLARAPLAPDRVSLIASCANVTPADLSRAAEVASVFASDGPARVAAAFDRALESTLALRGEALVSDDPHAGESFDLELANASAILHDLVSALARDPTGRFCFHGPPGSGKTAFAHHLARTLGLQLVLRRASDLLDKFVGQTEQAIAAAFRDAQPGRALLLLDEADSFLHTRSDATHGWEVSMVNELLVGLEAYRGLVVCCTNLMPSLDSAALRRFDLMVGFAPLTPAQRRRLLGDLAGTDPATLPAGLVRRLDALPDLTAGDYAALRRQSRFRPGRLTAGEVMEALEQRKRVGQAVGRRVGFGVSPV